MDSGALRGSTAGNCQYLSYCSDVYQEPHIDFFRAAWCHFRIELSTTEGAALIYFPVGELRISFEGHIVDGDASILLSIDYIDQLSIPFDKLRNISFYESAGMNKCIRRVGGRPFVRWNSNRTCVMRTIKFR